MRKLLITIAAALLVGCGDSQQSAPAPETEPTEPLAEVAKPEPPTAKAPDIDIHEAAKKGDIEAIKQHIAAGTDVNAKSEDGRTPLHDAVVNGHKEIAKLLIAEGADVNATDGERTPLHIAALKGKKETTELLITKGADVNAKGRFFVGTPLDVAIEEDYTKVADLLRQHGGKTGEELEAAGN